MLHAAFIVTGFLILSLGCCHGDLATPYEVRAGIVMVEKSVLPFKMEMVGPALDLAIEDAERLHGIRFLTSLRLYPDWCNSVATTGAVADLYYQVLTLALLLICLFVQHE